MENTVEAFIPIALFIVTGVMVGLVTYFRFRSKTEMQQTIRMALEKGTELSPELIDRLGDPQPGADRDLRRGLVWLALAVGLVLCGFFVPDPSGNALRGCLAGAAFPFTIGVAFMIMWWYGKGKDQAS